MTLGKALIGSMKNAVFFLFYILGNKRAKEIGIKKSFVLLLNPNKFTSVKTKEDFMFGIYDKMMNGTWRKMAKGEFEPVETSIVKKLIPSFGNFIDIGAHVGYFACLVANKNPEVSLLCFEPNPNNFKSLEKNISINHIKNSTLYNIGLSDTSGETLLFGIDAAGSINARTLLDTPREKTVVKIDRLDNYISYVPTSKSSFTKIDVEGSEYFILKGGLRFLESVKPVAILIEIVKYWSGGENPHFKDTFDLLHKHGYKSFIVDGQSAPRETGDVSNLAGGNYLFIRNDLTKKLLNI